MEISTPPNTSGFSRKPKQRKRINGRKSATRKSGFNPFARMSEEGKAVIFGSMFLIVAAKILGHTFGTVDIPAIRKTDVAPD